MIVDKLPLILKNIRESADIMMTIYTDGSCFRLYELIKILYPSAEAYWSDIDSHCITKVKGDYFDIGGKVKARYILDKSYFKIDKTQLEGYSLMRYSKEDNLVGVKVEKYGN